MNKQQDKLVNMLKWFHDTCIQNQLRYYIIAGTMLGAVRHKGFIPWDDDIDVGMPRSDYEKLRELSRDINEKSSYKFEYPGDNNPEYIYLFAKLYDSNTTFVEKKRHPIKRGIYIDIFPLDGMGNDMDIAKREYKSFYKVFQLDMMITAAFLKRRSFLKNAAVFLGRLISPAFVRHRKLARKIDRFCKRHDFDTSTLVCNLLGGAGTKGIVLHEYFGTPTLTQFENIEVYGLENPEPYLQSMYGDFMKLPPPEKRVSLHDAIYYNMEKSYLND